MVTTAERDLAGTVVTSTGTATAALVITATVIGLTAMASARRSSDSHLVSVPGNGITAGTGIGINLWRAVDMTARSSDSVSILGWLPGRFGSR